MIWNPQVFAAAHESLVSAAKSLDVAAIKTILDPIKEDLKDLLKTPPKSEASRSKLAQKSIEIDNEVFEANDAFLNDSARVADELNLDEMVSAKLSFYAIEDSRRLEIAIVEAAMTLFYVRRQYILDILRFALEVLPVSQFGLVLQNATERVDLFVAALKSVEKSLNDLTEKAKAGEFMGLDANPEFNQLLKLQRSFLIKEHESLGNILVAYLDATTPKDGYVKDNKSVNSQSSAEVLLDHVATFDTFDSRFVAYSSALIIWLSRPNSVAFSGSLWNYFQNQTKKNAWKLPIWRAAVALIYYTGLEDETLEAMPSADLDSLLEAVRHCIDEGAIEFWMGYAQDVSAQLGGYYFDKYQPLVRSRVPSLLVWQPVLSEMTLTNFKLAMVTLVVGFVTKFADILKEMRLNEEDMYLAMNEVEEDALAVSPGIDLERFFLFAAIVYRGNPEYTRTFFDGASDDGDVLHGFLVWASSCRATLMAATFAELVGSLASDEQTSEAVHKFMVASGGPDGRHFSGNKDANNAGNIGSSEDTTLDNTTNNTDVIHDNSPHPGSDDFALSWKSIIDVFEYYTHTPAPSAPSFSSSIGSTNLAYPPQSALPYSSLGSTGTSGVPGGTNFVMPSVVSAPAPTSSLTGVPGLGFSSAGIAFNGTSQSTGAMDGFSMQTVSAAPAATSFDYAASSQHPLSQSPEQLTDDTLLVLSAYMELISRVASQSEKVKDYFKDTTASNGNHFGRNFVPPLFRLLKLNQPINGATFKVLAAFASPEMWRPLDSIILGKFDEMLTSLQDALAFVDLLVEMVKTGHLSPKFNEYIDFIFKTVLPWTVTPENSITSATTATATATTEVETSRTGLLPNRINTSNTVQTIGRTVNNKSHGSASSQTHQVVTHNVCLRIQVGCLRIAKILLASPHPNESIFEIFFDTKVYDPLFKILSTSVDAVVNLNSDHPLVTSMTLAVQLASLLLKLSKPPHFTFDKPVLYHLQVIPHLALYAGAQHTQLSLASIELLSQLDNTSEFKPNIARQSRILSILSSTTEATRIRVGLMRRLSDKQTDLSVKIALLEMLADELDASGSPRNHMSVAHYLLGFRRSDLGLELKLELDAGIGGIQSGSSLLSVICDTLLYCLSDPGSNSNLLRLCSIVLGHLCEDPLTSNMTLNYLRQFDFWINTIKFEPISLSGTPDVSERLLEYRALMLEMWNREMQLCQQKLLLTIESHYVDALVPIAFLLVDLSHIHELRVALRCLSAWCKLIPVLLIDDGHFNTRLDTTFAATVMQRLVECLPLYSRQNTDFAEPVADLLVILFEKFQLNGVDNTTARHSLVLFRSALESMQPAQMNTCLREHLYSLFCQCLKLCLDTGTTETKQMALDTLIENGSRIFQIACDDILTCYNERLRYSALLFIEMATVLGQSLTSKVVALILLKYNFIPVFVLQVLEPTVNDLYHSFLNTGKAVATFGSGNSGNNVGDTNKRVDNNLQNSSNDDGDEADQFTQKVATNVQNKRRLLRAGFSLLLPIAQTREGAADLFGSVLLPLYKKSLGSLDDELLSLSLRIMISMLISTGRDNEIVVQKVRGVLDMHQKTIQDVLHRDASLSIALQDQESELSLLAREVTIIVSLTNTKLARV